MRISPSKTPSRAVTTTRIASYWTCGPRMPRLRTKAQPNRRVGRDPSPRQMRVSEPCSQEVHPVFESEEGLPPALGRMIPPRPEHMLTKYTRQARLHRFGGF